MPDLSLLKPLCNILDITINELLCGEYISKNGREKNLEENIVNAINYSKKRQNINELIFYLFILIFGILMIIISMSIFCTPIGFTMKYSIIGTYALIIIFSYLLMKIITNNKARKYVIFLITSFFILYLGYLWTVDLINVKRNGGNPDIFVISSMIMTHSYSYDTIFYDLHICNINQKDEYRKIVFDLNHDNILDSVNEYCNQ